MTQEDISAGASGAGSILSAMGAGQGGDAENVRAFWRRVERWPAGAQVRQDASRAERQLVIVSGWACELRILPDGRRQIFGFLLPGDPVDGCGSVGSRAVVALTRLEVVDSGPHLAHGCERREAVARARHAAALERERRLYDHLVRMGRLTAKERVVHLLLELCQRLERVGLVKGDSFKIPLTQEIFADALGLSVVHINRTLKELRRAGSVSIRMGTVTLTDRSRLAAVACYRRQDEDAIEPMLDRREPLPIPHRTFAA